MKSPATLKVPPVVVTGTVPLEVPSLVQTWPVFVVGVVRVEVEGPVHALQASARSRLVIETAKVGQGHRAAGRAVGCPELIAVVPSLCDEDDVPAQNGDGAQTSCRRRNRSTGRCRRAYRRTSRAVEYPAVCVGRFDREVDRIPERDGHADRCTTCGANELTSVVPLAVPSDAQSSRPEGPFSVKKIFPPAAARLSPR